MHRADSISKNKIPATSVASTPFQVPTAAEGRVETPVATPLVGLDLYRPAPSAPASKVSALQLPKVYTPSSLAQFTAILVQTGDARRSLVSSVLSKRAPDPALVSWLADVSAALAKIPGAPMEAKLSLSETSVGTFRIAPELKELQRDVIFFQQGEEALLAHLAAESPTFKPQVEKGVAFLHNALDGKSAFRRFITDRDGTVNNYVDRYGTSTQGAYNAIWMARAPADESLVLTSAPLNNGGLIDLSVLPEGAYHLVGSMGREILSRTGQAFQMEVPEKQQKVLDALNEKIAALVSQPDYVQFAVIGSGFQKKVGQITLAHQDMNQSVPQAESERLCEIIQGYIATLDPKHEVLDFERLTTDIDIRLKVEGETAFDKGHGLKFAAESLGWNLSEGGPLLIGGDTGSDVPMVTAALEANPDVFTIFSTTSQNVIDKVIAAAGDPARVLIVDSPDALVAILRQASIQIAAGQEYF